VVRKSRGKNTETSTPLNDHRKSLKNKKKKRRKKWCDSFAKPGKGAGKKNGREKGENLELVNERELNKRGRCQKTGKSRRGKTENKKKKKKPQNGGLGNQKKKKKKKNARAGSQGDRKKQEQRAQTRERWGVPDGKKKAVEGQGKNAQTGGGKQGIRASKKNAKKQKQGCLVKLTKKQLHVEMGVLNTKTGKKARKKKRDENGTGKTRDGSRAKTWGPSPQNVKKKKKRGKTSKQR